MSTRILSCSNNIDNYYMCINNKVAGFVHNGVEVGDKVYLSVKVSAKHLCGARFEIVNTSAIHPWNLKNGKKYFSFQINNIEYCNPFELDKLVEYEPWWLLKYLVGAKPITNNASLNYLKENFMKNKTQSLVYF